MTNKADKIYDIIKQAGGRLKASEIPTNLSYISIDIYSSSYIPAVIEKANHQVKQKLKKAIETLSWKEFESTCLAQILDELGFTSIEITQPTQYGEQDALCKYKRGLVYSEAIVSAKHWKNKIDLDEVQRVRGIKGIADTGIIVTSSEFTKAAKTEAAPSQNSRAIVLIDGDLIVETCFKRGIGVKMVELPPLYEFDPTSFSSDAGG
jgi:restriction endonuclease Mrr